MYTPSSFRETDLARVGEFIQRHNFGLLLTAEGGRVSETHTPLLLSTDRTTLRGHLAKANPHWRSWDESTTAKVVFSGPHAYVSPSYYASGPNVPTWNYTSVSVSGPLSIVHRQDEAISFLESLVSWHEREQATPWRFDMADPTYANLLDGIVVFEVEISELDASFKLNQNKSRENQRSVADHLGESADPLERQVSRLMERNLARSA